MKRTVAPPPIALRPPGVGIFFVDELRQQFRSRALWICFLLMSLIFYRYVSDSYWDELVGSGRVPVNAPVVVYYIFAFATEWAAIFATSFLTVPVLRDLRYSVAPIVYAMPFRDRDYLIGKYLAGQVALLFVMSGVYVGFVLLSWVEPSISSDSLHSYMPMPWGQATHSFILFLFPACFFFGSVHFTLASLTGRMTASYAFVVIVTLVFLGFEMSFQGDTFAKRWPEILDPVGYIALQGQVFYWTAEQRITEYVHLNDTMLLNRALYLGLGALSLIILSWKANLRGLLQRSRAQGRGSALTNEDRSALVSPSQPPSVGRVVSTATVKSAGVLSVARLGWQQFRQCAGETWFIVALAAAFIMAFSLSLRLGALYGLPEGNLLPTALDVLDKPLEMYVIVGIIVVAFAVGEILSRERVCRVQLMVDATAASSWLLIGAKLIACVLVVLTFTLTPALATLSAQVIKRYGDIEWSLYLYRFGYGVLPSLATYAAIAAVIHIITNQRALAHALAILTCFSVFMMEEIKVVEHPLLLIGYPVLTPLTAFDALGQFNAKLLHLNAYYLALAGFLLVASSWIWPRGVETGLARRVKRAGKNMGVASIAAALICLAIAGASALVVYDTVNTRNSYRSVQQKKAEDALYERRYRGLGEAPQPKVIAANISVDLYPRERRMRYRAALTLQNKADVPVRALDLRAAEYTQITCFATDDAGCTQPDSVDSEFRVYRYRLKAPLAPGQTRHARLEVLGVFEKYEDKGFHGPLVRDGTFMTDSSWPIIGYERSQELTLTGDRRFHHLGARTPLPPATDAASVRELAVSSQADRLSYELTVSTDPGQLVIAPGELVQTLQQNGRAIFRFRSPDATWKFALASASYAASRGTWENNAGLKTDIVVYHLPRHPYNVKRFLSAAQTALDVFTPVFGPLPYSELRIVEVPENLAQKTDTAGNVIAIPEKDGWLHDYRSDPRRDWVLYTVARETARMWWGQDVAPGEMRGSVLLTQAIPEYLALRVVERADGIDKALDLLDMKRDIYLRQRVKEDQLEHSVLETEDEKFAGNKGLLALFEARNILGPERLDAALQSAFGRLRQRVAPPFANAAELLETLESFAADEGQRSQLAAAFTQTRLYDFHLRTAHLASVKPGSYKMSLLIDADRFDVTKDSNHAPTPFSAPVPIVAYRADARLDHAYVTSAELNSGRNVVSIDVPFAPARVAIDPLARFIDLNIRDNTRGID